MNSFNTLYNEYEKTKDVHQFVEKYKENDEGLRFLLVRSFDKSNIIEIMKDTIVVEGKLPDMMAILFNSRFTNKDIIQYIKSKKDDIENERTEKEAGLSEIIKNYGIVNCGLRNDKVDDLVKSLVRDKSIKTIDELNNKIDCEIIPRIRNYISWSFYNQVTNDLIEHFFIRHEKIIPTLRKIHDVDFFIEVGEKIIPFDLKITHIADDCFDVISTKPLESEKTFPDQFVINPKSKSEIDLVKDYYKEHKKEWNLPNYSKLTKNELIEELSKTKNASAIKFTEDCMRNRVSLIQYLKDNLSMVEWWNYKYQGERLFNNNNRFFVFLAYEDSFEDGRPIKGDLERIEREVTSMLDNFSEKDIHTLRYYYEKDRSLEGKYTVQSTSLLLTEKHN